MELIRGTDGTYEVTTTDGARKLGTVGRLRWRNWFARRGPFAAGRSASGFRTRMAAASYLLGLATGEEAASEAAADELTVLNQEMGLYG